MPNETDSASGSKRSGQPPLENLLAISALVGAFILYLAVGEWPSQFYTFSHWTTFALSLAIARFAWFNDAKGWLALSCVGAFIFNPVQGVSPARVDWALVSAVYAVFYGLFGIGLLQAKVAKIGAWVFGASTAIALAMTFYVNKTMPRGEMHPTGDIVCMNDGQGPCGEGVWEDVSQLDIPIWAKFLRANFVWSWFFLLGGTIICHTRSTQRGWSD